MDIHSFLQQEVQSLHDAETQLVECLGFLASKAQSDDLRSALLEHRDETMEHVTRLETICREIGCTPTGKSDSAIRTLVTEAQETFFNAPRSAITDACIISAAQKVEHLEMASYGTAIALADEMEHHATKNLLSKTLDEEKSADHRLTKIAEHGINKQAVALSGPAYLR